MRKTNKKQTKSITNKKGIYYDNRVDKFYAKLAFSNGKGGAIQIHLGTFNTAKEAYERRKNYILGLID